MEEEEGEKQKGKQGKMEQKEAEPDSPLAGWPVGQVCNAEYQHALYDTLWLQNRKGATKNCRVTTQRHTLQQSENQRINMRTSLEVLTSLDLSITTSIIQSGDESIAAD